MNNDFNEKIKQYEDMDSEVRPPCHEELMVPLFEIYKAGKTLSGGKTQTPIERIRVSYPQIGESDLIEIVRYLDGVQQFCINVSSCFAKCYRTPFIPQSEKALESASRVMQACQNRYTWMQEEQIAYILSSVCWLTNR